MRKGGEGSGAAKARGAAGTSCERRVPSAGASASGAAFESCTPCEGVAITRMSWLPAHGGTHGLTAALRIAPRPPLVACPQQACGSTALRAGSAEQRHGARPPRPSMTISRDGMTRGHMDEAREEVAVPAGHAEAMAAASGALGCPFPHDQQIAVH